MQRYRVNVPLFVGLIVGSIVLAGGSYFLYSFQKSRSASRLLEREKAARDAGDTEESISLLSQYLGIRPNDEDASCRLAETLMEVAEQPRSEPRDIQVAIQQGEAAARNFPDRDKLRRRLVDLYMSPRIRALKPALDHIGQLLNRTPGDPELEAMQSQCFFAAASPKAIDHAFRLVGYDAKTDGFDASKGIAPNEPTVYLRLAQGLRSDRADSDLADRVIEQMIEANPKSGTAHLLRGQYREVYESSDAAAADIQKALELDPKDPTIVAASARLAARDERFDEAQALLQGALKEHPTNPMLYLTLSQVQASADDIETSIATCETGLKETPEDQWSGMLVQKTQLELRTDKPSDAAATIKRMRESRSVPEAYPEYFEARLAMTADKYFEAAETFDKFEAFMTTNNPPLAVELNVMLGLCREKLGQEELALAAYERALRADRKNTVADLGRKRMLAELGGARPGLDAGEGLSIYAALQLELSKPEAEQDWEAFDKAAKAYTEQMQLGDAMLEVLRGEIFMRRKMYPEARAKLIGAFNMDKDNLGVRRAAVKLFAADPEQGPVKALKLLDKVVEDFGDLPILRLERADLLSIAYPDDLTEQLFALSDGTDSWDKGEKAQLWRGLADKFARLGDNESRAECLRRLAEVSPGDLPTLLERFRIARDGADEKGMTEAQGAILAVVGSKQDPTWLFVEAQRLLAVWAANGGTGPEIDSASELIERALAKRPEWHELHNLKADVALAKRDVSGALDSYDRAAQLGRQEARELYQYIKLLMSRARFADALDQLEKISREGRLRLLGQDYAECLLQLGRVNEALVAADEFATQSPNAAPVQLWLGRFYTRAASTGPNDEGSAVKGERKTKLIEDAGLAFERVVELDPNSAEGWLSLVGYYAATKDGVKADDTIRRAQLVLEEDQSQLLFARCYEMVGRGIDAEAIYTQALETADESEVPRVAHLAAQFYLGPAYRGRDAAGKATPLVNQILRGVVDGKIPAEDPNARWARTTAARLLARGGTYQQLLDAERLLASNSEAGVLPVEDRLLMAEILGPRPEPVSRQKAARLLEEIGQNQRLTKKSELDLGKLYFALGDWRKCREKMLAVISTYPDDVEARLAYLEMLLQRGEPADIDLAVRQVQRLQEVAPKLPVTRDMLARVAFAKGKKREAAQAVLSLLPRSAEQVTPEMLPMVRQVATRLVAFEDNEGAQKLFELAAKVGGVDDKLQLAQFLGERIDPEKGLDSLEKFRDEVPPTALIQRSLGVLRAADASDTKPTDGLFERVQGWITRALREDPDLAGLRLQQAELHDLRREYDKAAEVYRAELKRPELTGPTRAVVLNNLAYLLALAEKDPAALAEAEKYVAEAVDILGPGSEILDTRGVIAIAAKRFDAAVADLELAVIDRPTPSKFFHLASAYMGAGKPESASTAWQKALDMGIDRDDLSRLEREAFDRVKQQIESGAITSVGG